MQGNTHQTTWVLDSIDGFSEKVSSVLGKPEAIHTEVGAALYFDGKEDGIFLAENPLAGMERFTVEAIFRPDRKAPGIQKFIHFGDAHGDRFLFETRVPDPDNWCFDAALHSGKPSLALMDPGLLHELDHWYHAAVTFAGLEMITYINGERELSGTIDAFSPIMGEATSIGVRMDLNSWFRGAISIIRVSPGILDPEKFLVSGGKI